METGSPLGTDFPVPGKKWRTLFGFPARVADYLPLSSTPPGTANSQPHMPSIKRTRARNWFLGVCAVLFISAAVFLYSEESVLAPLKFTIPRPLFHPSFYQLFPIGNPGQANIWQDRNSKAMRSLIDCMTAGSCGENQTSIIMLADFHFSNAMEGHTSGEDIWALSVENAVIELGYTVLYSGNMVIAAQQYRMMPDLVKAVITEAEDVYKCFEASSCIKNRDNLLGIPVWKLFSFHFWNGPAHPLGRPWTLSPEDFHNGNQYLGYSVEESCMEKHFIPHAEREEQIWVMGKHVSYFHHWEYAWSDDIYSILHDNLPEHLAAGVDDDGGGYTYPAFIHNYGHLNKTEFYSFLSRSRALLGIGIPPLSPSPYDALCFGVPFINPILHWDENRPTDRTRWATQHEGLNYIEPPYVYHVYRNDSDGLLAALREAVANPIDRFIPPNMLQESLRNRVGHLVEYDWRTIAEEILGNRTMGLDDGPRFDL